MHFSFHRCRERTARGWHGLFFHAHVGQRRCWRFVRDHQEAREAARRPSVRFRRTRRVNRRRDTLHRNLSIASRFSKEIAHKTILTHTTHGHINGSCNSEEWSVNKTLWILNSTFYIILKRSRNSTWLMLSLPKVSEKGDPQLIERGGATRTGCEDNILTSET